MDDGAWIGLILFLLIIAEIKKKIILIWCNDKIEHVMYNVLLNDMLKLITWL